MPSADYKVEIVDSSGQADMSVTVIGDQVVDLTGATDGQVLTVQPDGTVAPESPAADPAAVPKSLYDANTVLKADADNTPVALTMAASTILARLASGSIVAATVAQIKTLLAYVVGDIPTAAPLTPTVGTGLGTTGSVNLDFGALNGTFQTIALSGNITFTTSNLAAGRSVTLFISAASLRTFTFPAWIFVGAAAPANIAAGKAGVLTLTATSTTDASVYAAWAVAP